MILVDSSVWIDHLRAQDPALTRLLEESLVLAHPWVTGEIALGNLRDRSQVLGSMNKLSQATVATDHEVRHLIEQKELYGLGIGYVDAQLLTSTMLSAEAKLWTRDKRLSQAAHRLGRAFTSAPHPR